MLAIKIDTIPMTKNTYPLSYLNLEWNLPTDIRKPFSVENLLSTKYTVMLFKMMFNR